MERIGNDPTVRKQWHHLNLLPSRVGSSPGAGVTGTVWDSNPRSLLIVTGTIAFNHSANPAYPALHLHSSTAGQFPGNRYC